MCTLEGENTELSNLLDRFLIDVSKLHVILSNLPFMTKYLPSAVSNSSHKSKCVGKFSGHHISLSYRRASFKFKVCSNALLLLRMLCVPRFSKAHAWGPGKPTPHLSTPAIVRSATIDHVPLDFDCPAELTGCWKAIIRKAGGVQATTINISRAVLPN